MLMRPFYRVRVCMSVIVIFALLSAFGQEFSIVQLINPLYSCPCVCVPVCLLRLPVHVLTNTLVHQSRIV